MSDWHLVAPGLISYRCRSQFAWIMIGAKDSDDAMKEARRSYDKADPATLQIWDPEVGAYVAVPVLP